MLKKLWLCLISLMPVISFADTAEVISNAQEIMNAVRIACSGISDEIAKVANISKANTAVAAVGTVAAGGALVAGIKKSQEEEEIDNLIAEMCANGGCTADGVRTMSNEQFFNVVLQPMGRIAELQERIDKSKKLGNWRTGLMAGTIGTNLATAVMSGLNINQSDLVQHITACNDMVDLASNVELELKAAGVGPMDSPVVKELGNVKTWCNQINVSDIEKIEKRMKGVMGTSIAGVVIGGVGTAVSAKANSDKYTDAQNRAAFTNEENKAELQKGKNLNTTANIMAGANVATGLVETGLNISLIKLTKNLMGQAERCEEVLQ